MPRIRRLLLDVLKPNHPSVLELARLLTDGVTIQARLTVVEMDDQTQTLQIEVSGEDIDFERLRDTIDEFGASLHSIDEVEIENTVDSSG